MKIFFIGIAAIVAAVLAGALLLPARSEAPLSAQSGVIATNGLHWHPTLKIFVKGEELPIPANVGLGAVHQPIHTHEDMPVLHLEFNGRVTEDDLKLGNFFHTWEKDMRSFGSNMRMTVNGEVNDEYENYVLRDGDAVELRYD